MSEDCEATQPGHPEVVCQKGDHPWGAHINMDLGVTWPGNPMPEKPKKGRDQSRLAKMQKAIDEYAHGNTRTGPPVASSGARVAQPMSQAQGMASAHQAASEEFKAEARSTIERLARSQESLTTDDVWSDLRSRGWDTEHRACMGTLIRNASSKGLIEKTNQMVSTERDDQRAHGLIVWRSLVYQPTTK